MPKRANQLLDELLSNYKDVDIGNIYSYNIDTIGLDGFFTADALIHIAICMKTVEKMRDHIEIISEG